MTASSISLFLLLVIASIYALTGFTRSESVLSGETALKLVDPGSLHVRGHDHERKIRRAFFRRDCDCVTTTGRCMSYGRYQCFFSGGRASIVQCVGGNKWVNIGNCPSSCRSWANDQPYCS